VAKFRILLAAAYSCRAIVELMLEETTPERDALTVDREGLTALFVAKLPYFRLIERVRIHDFHRYGLSPPIPGVNHVMYRGPTTLTVGGDGPGTAFWTLGRNGPETFVKGSGKVKEHRPLLEVNGAFYDDATKTYVPLSKIIREYLLAMPAMIDEFNKLYKDPDGHKPYEGD
jgi:hypothetical protein